MELFVCYFLIVGIILLWNLLIKSAIKDVFKYYLRVLTDHFKGHLDSKEARRQLADYYHFTLSFIDTFSFADLTKMIRLIESQPDTAKRRQKNEQLAAYSVLAFDILYACLYSCTLRGFPKFFYLVVLKCHSLALYHSVRHFISQYTQNNLNKKESEVIFSVLEQAVQRG